MPRLVIRVDISVSALATPVIYLFLIFKKRTRKRTNETRPPTDCQLATSNGLFAN